MVGRAKGLVCAVARTDRRLLIVADRAGRPLVESLRPDKTVVGVQRSPDATVTLVVSDGRRVMRLQHVRETVEAELLAGSAGSSPSYF